LSYRAVAKIQNEINGRSPALFDKKPLRAVAKM
jgi:hypothetical protein